MTNVNDVTLQGKIVHKFVTDKVAIITINTGNATPKPNYPKVVCFGDLKDTVNNLYEVGDKVRVEGNLQSSKFNKDIKNQTTLSIFGEKIEPAYGLLKNEFENENVENEGYVPFTNQFKVAGELVRINKVSDSIVRFTILTRKNNRISYVRLVRFTDKPDEVIEKFTPGMQVYAIGNVQTVKKEFNNEVRHFENYVATSLSTSAEE